MAGRRIDDHSFWAGKAEKGGVFPREAKMKQESSASGYQAAGSMEYSDTTESIRKDQEQGLGKMKSNKMKPGYRY